MVTYEDKILEERAQGKKDGIQIGVLRTIDDIQSLVDNGMTLEEAFNAVKKSVKTQ